MATTYVYIRSEQRLWTVGFHTPSGEWVPESDHGTAEDAAARVHYLNGGMVNQRYLADMGDRADAHERARRPVGRPAAGN